MPAALLLPALVAEALLTRGVVASSGAASHEGPGCGTVLADAGEHWWWMGTMLLFCLDSATLCCYNLRAPMRWYSITYREDPPHPGIRF
jgi:hypothetical protein